MKHSLTIVALLVTFVSVSADDTNRINVWKSDLFREVVHLNERGDRLEQVEALDADSLLSLSARIHTHEGEELPVPIPEMFTNIDVFRLSNAGQVVGTATRPVGDPRGNQSGIVHDRRKKTTELLPHPESYRGSSAFDISADGNRVSGFVVGRDPPRVQPCVWQRGQDGWECMILETDLQHNPFLVGGRVAISDDGQRVVASIAVQVAETSRRSFLTQWQEGEDGQWSRRMLSKHAVHVADVNNQGMVAGRITRRGRRMGYVFHPDSGPHEFGPLPGDHNAEATAVNNRGVVVGISDDPPGPDGGTEAIVWDKDQIQRLAFPFEVVFSSAKTIQDDGTIGGWLIRISDDDPEQAETGAFVLEADNPGEADGPVR